MNPNPHAPRGVRRGVAIALALAALASMPIDGVSLAGGNAAAGETPMALTLTSSAFHHNGPMPVTFTCEGEDLSPPLAWMGVPAEAKSLVLIVDDPDAPDPKAPRMTWVHWVLYNLPANSKGLAEAVAPDSLPAGTMQGLNDWKRTGWGGPCPPIGRHRYVHKLYALDVVLPDLGKATKADVLKAMEKHVVGRAELIGTYEKKKKG